VSPAVEFSWHLLPDASSADADALATEIEDDGESRPSVLDAGTGLVPEAASLVVTGMATLTILAARIERVVCRVRKSGLIIDARQQPLLIAESHDVPGGTILTITADGAQHEYDACKTGVDLPAILSGLRERR
jgi:hypothetical protein